jgi:hypothetical protein
MLGGKHGATDALLKREFHRRAKGPVMNDEDWWRLVFDTDAKRIYVEHEWAHTMCAWAVRLTTAPPRSRSQHSWTILVRGQRSASSSGLLTNLFEVGRDA